MIKIPSQENKFIVPSTSDLFGNIAYTKNFNFDEPGYAKLSSRVISLYSELRDSNFGLATAMGRGNLVGTALDIAITQNRTTGWVGYIREDTIGFKVDSGINRPTEDTSSHARWFQNLWTVSNDTDFFTKAGIGDSQTYTDQGNLTTGKPHPVEVFRSKVAVCIGDGNKVKSFGITYTPGVVLTIPTDFDVVGLAYSNGTMGIIANPSSTAPEQNQDAQFFTWDGVFESGSPGIPIGSDNAIGIVAYEGSWVVLTRQGQLLFYTGGGFTELASFPFYFNNIDWGNAGTRKHLGDIMVVEGSSIYININGLFNETNDNLESYMRGNPGGIWCYDKSVGLYQRYSPSISPAYYITVASAGINTTTDIMTVANDATTGVPATLPPTGSQMKYTADRSSAIGGLYVPKIYYIIKHTATTFSLATSYQNAIDGVKVDLTTTGAANNYFLGVETLDYGQNMATQSGAIMLTGKQLPTYNHILFASELNDAASTGNSYHMSCTSAGFDNRGYIVTAKIPSSTIEDVGQKLYIKNRPLSSTSKIIVKYKKKDIYGLPISTPQNRAVSANQCAWVSSTVFTTTADLSVPLANYATEELECEIIAGAGAGNMPQISSITYNAGTYTVTLAESVDGASSGRFCDVIIENWTKIDEITSANTNNIQEFPIAQESKWFQFKIEARGRDVTIEELAFINQDFKSS